jgi:signal transduction histidine kinase
MDHLFYEQTPPPELQRSRDTLRAIFDNLDEGLLLLDGDGRILAANHALCQLAARRPQELVGRPYATLWAELEGHAGQLATFNGPGVGAVTSIEDLRQPGGFRAESAAWRLHLQSSAGEERWFTVERQPIADRAGPRCLERWRDITQQEELQRRMLANEQMISLGRLAAGIAHEVGNPLQSAMSCLELCGEEEEMSSRVREYMGLALGELGRMGRILDSLRTLYRPPQASWALIDLNDMLHTMQRLTRQQLARQRITMRLDLDDSLPAIYGQPDSLRQVLLNLTLNAQEAIGEGGEIVVTSRLCSVEGRCLITMADNGPGLSAEQQEHLFEPFRSGKDRGVGLGLYLSKQIIDQHGGQISVESRPGQPTTVTLSLPIHTNA